MRQIVIEKCKNFFDEIVIDKIPKKEPSELLGNKGSETEIGVMEPSQSLFNDNRNGEN